MINGAVLLGVTYAIRPPSQMTYTWTRPREVGDLLRPEPVMPAPEAPLSAFLDCLIREGGQSAAAYPVVRDGQVVGVISPGVAAEALGDGTDERTVAEAMVRKEDAVMLRPEMSIEEAFAAFGDESALGVVIADDRLVGILRRSDVADALLEAQDEPEGSMVPASPPPLNVDW